jgi:TonB-dependent receptor
MRLHITTLLQISLVALIFGLIHFPVFAQNGTIIGTVTDATTGETIYGANVMLEGTTIGASTDMDGKFTISNVKPGNYTLLVSFITYTPARVADVQVGSAQIVNLSLPMVEDVAEMEEITVVATREVSTDLALLKSIRESMQVVSGISAEQIIKVPDRDAAQVMQRVPGVTIIDNKFVMIRGVGERYNQVMINSAIAPSTEVDRRTFSFDLIPSGLIDQILIYKSGSPWLPGDFSGGVIQVKTKNSVSEPFTSLTLSGGYRFGTTFQDYVQSQGSKTDILGFDNGFRDLPSSFPTTFDLQESGRSSMLRQDAGRSLTNNFGNTTRSALPDMGINFAMGRQFEWLGKDITNVTSIGYSNSYQNYRAEFYRYFTFVPGQETPRRFQYEDDYYSQDVRISALTNFVVQLNANNKIEFKNLFNQLGENTTITRFGQDLLQDANRDFQNYSYHYVSRSILSSQVEGTHTSADDRKELRWMAGINYLNRNEPDFRRFRTFRNADFRGTEEPFQMQLPPSANLFETGRFYSILNEMGVSQGADLDIKLNETTNPSEQKVLKFGYLADYRTRDFNARYVSYLYPGFSDIEEGERLKRLPIDEIFAPENIRTVDGFVIEEGTRPTDRYNGSSFVGAAYAGGVIPVGNFNFSGGFRLEYFQQLLNTQNDFEKINVDNRVISPLPFMNVAYNLSGRSLVRMAYSKTVNRPEFREIAPFLYYDFELELGVRGNPNLKVADIQNVDLRYEIYPSPNELISLGVFYKYFTNPIESFLRITTESPQLTYNNAEDAYSRGVEIEIRKSLGSLGMSRFLQNTSVNLNASYIDSRVDLGDAATAQDQKRALQGQSPYIVNSGLYYNDTQRGFSVNLAYNVFGARIFAVGDLNFPTIYELPRNSMDISVSKRISARGELKFSVQDVFNAPYRFYQDSNVDGKIDIRIDDPILTFNRGQLATLSYRVRF